MKEICNSVLILVSFCSNRLQVPTGNPLSCTYPLGSTITGWAEAAVVAAGAVVVVEAAEPGRRIRHAESKRSVLSLRNSYQYHIKGQMPD